MLASMLGGIAIPEAFGDRALLLVGGYLGLQFIRNAFMVLATARASEQARPPRHVEALSLEQRVRRARKRPEAGVVVDDQNGHRHRSIRRTGRVRPHQG